MVAVGARRTLGWVLLTSQYRPTSSLAPAAARLDILLAPRWPYVAALSGSRVPLDAVDQHTGARPIIASSSFTTTSYSCAADIRNGNTSGARSAWKPTLSVDTTSRRSVSTTWHPGNSSYAVFAPATERPLNNGSVMDNRP